MQLFYSTLINERNIILDEQDSKHCVRVLRMQAGDKVEVTDGKGNLFITSILDNHPKKTVLTIEERNFFESSPFNLHIAVAPTKNISRMEWFVEKATEIGISKITPIICQHSERRIVKSERLRKIMISAAKQSLKFHFPIIEEPINFEKLISQPFDEAEKFVGWCDKAVDQSLKNTYTKGKDAIVLIGPEGDFSPEEVEEAKNKGFLPIMMGENRLRTETAALVACHTINLLNE